jgi:hypothetical protein
MADLNAHEAGNGGQGQGKPTARGVLLYSEFRTYRVLELALYHSLGKLPEPESTHDFV